MDIDEFLTKVENGEKIDFEKPKSHVDEIIEDLNKPDMDKIAAADKVIHELGNYEEKLKNNFTYAQANINRIKQLLLDIRNRMNSNELITAKNIFATIGDIFELISDDYLEEKNDLRKDMTGIESQLLTKLADFYKKDFERKRRIILMSMSQAKQFLKDKNVEGAVKEYRRCQQIYYSLPDGFIIQKIEIYEEIIELYKEVLISAQINNLENKLVI